MSNCIWYVVVAPKLDDIPQPNFCPLFENFLSENLLICSLFPRLDQTKGR